MVLQHNCQKSWNAIEILFSFCVSLPHPPDIVALQEIPYWKGRIPSHPLYQGFVPPPAPSAAPTVATLVRKTLCEVTTVHIPPSCPSSPNLLSLIIESPSHVFTHGPRAVLVHNVYLPPTRDSLRVTASASFPPSSPPSLPWWLGISTYIILVGTRLGNALLGKWPSVSPS